MSTKAKNFLRRMKQRLVIIFGIALLFFVVLIGRVIYISLAKGQEYQEEYWIRRPTTVWIFRLNGETLWIEMEIFLPPVRKCTI